MPGKRRHGAGLLGQLHCHRWEAYHSGYASLLFRTSVAILLASRARRQVRPHLLWCKAAGAGRRQGESPSTAGQHSVGGEIDRRFPLVPPVCAQGFLVMLRYIVRIEVAHIGNTILTYAEKGVYCTHKRHMSEKEGEHAKTMQTQARLRYAWLQALWADGWRCGIRAATHCADGR